MNDLMADLSKLSAAEEFFEFFGVGYDQAVVNVNRLHILKRFHQYLRSTPNTAEMDRDALAAACRELLTRAYRDFVTSTPAQEKVFKVFQDQDGRSVPLEVMRGALPSQR